MRKIVMLNRISGDGFFASLKKKSWGMDWFVQDPDVDKAAHKLVGRESQPDTLILGGTTYRGLEKSWTPWLTDPKAPKEMKAVAEELTAMTKVVFSKTLKAGDITWDNSELHAGNLIGAVEALKRSKGAGIMIMGSGTIVQQLATKGLIDEYVFILTPVIAGEGKPLFKDVNEFGLELLSAKSFDSGNVLLHYGLAK
ncbi:MAG: dihydrofolate reductase family protein [Gemmatimonas sp.]